MRLARLAAAGILSSLALAACGGDGGSGSPSAATGGIKPRTLTARDYPVMRDWIINEDIEVAKLRPICRQLDAAPGTRVVAATRDACDRVLSVMADIEDAAANIDCESGDRACVVRYLRASQSKIAAIIDAAIDYIHDIDAVLGPGPCRDVLADSDDVDKAKRYVRDYERAIDDFAAGDDEALDRLDDDDDDEVDDPTVCRPAEDA